MAVVANESLVDKGADFTLRRFDHLTCKRSKSIQLTGVELQFNMPRNVLTHMLPHGVASQG